MTDAPRSADDDPQVGTEPGSLIPTPHRRPRWVTVSLAVVGILVLVIVILQLTGIGPGAGRHGPGRHGGAGVPVVSISADDGGQ
jgi:hypothetical protein